MAARGPRELSNLKFIDILRNIIGQILRDEELLQTQGLLRIAGISAETADILEKGEIPVINKANIHTVLDVTKRILPILRERIKDIDPEGLAQLQQASKALNDLDQGSLGSTSTALIQFIERLVSSRDREKEIVAEALHSYIHLGVMISQYADINKMTPDNCAIVIGPKFNEILDLVPMPVGNDPVLVMSAVAKSALVNNLIRQCIESGKFNVCFDEKYAEVRYQSRQYMFDTTMQQAEKTSRSLQNLTTLIDRINTDMQQTQRTIDTLTFQKHRLKGRLLHKKTIQEKQFLKQTNELLKQAKTNLKSLAKQLQALQPDIEIHEKSRVKFVKAREQLRNSMDRLEIYRIVSSSESTSDLRLGNDSDEDIHAKKSSRSFTPAANVATTPRSVSSKGSSEPSEESNRSVAEAIALVRGRKYRF